MPLCRLQGSSHQCEGSISWVAFLLSSRRTQCPGLHLNIRTFQDLIFSSLLKLVSCFPGSDFPVHPGCLERAHSPTETWTDTSAPRTVLFPLTPVLSYDPTSGTSFSQWKDSAPARGQFGPCTLHTNLRLVWCSEEPVSLC